MYIQNKRTKNFTVVDKFAIFLHLQQDSVPAARFSLIRNSNIRHKDTKSNIKISTFLLYG